MINFLFELGLLKKIKHCGTMFAGVREPDSIAEHCARASQIAFIIAEKENCDSFKAAFMASIHDNGEIRIGDHHNIAKKYFNADEAERKAFEDQSKSLPADIGQKFYSLFQEFESQKTLESHCAKDADYLETCLEAKEQYDLGYTACMKWLDNVEKCLKTKTGKEIFKQLKTTRFDEWWQDLN